MAKITVYPTKQSALLMTHPIDGKVRLAGSAWEQDGYTYRLITDGILTIDPDRAWRAPEPKAPAAPAAAPVAAEAEPEAKSAAPAASAKAK